MARPQKFRHSREALSDPAIAMRLAGFVLDIEALRAKRQQVDDQIAAAYDLVDDAGFEKKFVRKNVALRAKETVQREDEEHGIAAYEEAIEKGVSLVRTRRERFGALPAHNPKTGEIIEHEPATTSKGESDAKSADHAENLDHLIGRRRQELDQHEQDRSEQEQVRSGRNIATFPAPRNGGGSDPAGLDAPTESAEHGISEPIHEPAPSSLDAAEPDETVDPPSVSSGDHSPSAVLPPQSTAPEPLPQDTHGSGAPIPDELIVPHIRKDHDRLNPDCQKPATCKWARSMASCSACAQAAFKARAA